MSTVQKSRISSIEVFLNQSSGWGTDEDVPKLMREFFERQQIQANVSYVKAGDDIEVLARRAAVSGVDAVIAGGGDGTVRAVAAGLRGTGAALGILPVGTLNHFARDLRIPLDWRRATETIASGKVIQVDLGEVNGRVFINNSIIGLYPRYRFQKDHQLRKGRSRVLAFLWACYSVARRYPFFTLRFMLEDHQIVKRTPFVLIGNNEHEMEGYSLGSRATIRNGQLWVYVMNRTGRMSLVRMAISVALGLFSKARDFDVFPAKELWIGARQKRLGVALDGEVAILDTPLRYRSLPQALNVIVPRDYPEKGE